MVRCALMEECDRRMTKLGRVEQAGAGWAGPGDYYYCD